MSRIERRARHHTRAKTAGCASSTGVKPRSTAGRERPTRAAGPGRPTMATEHYESDDAARGIPDLVRDLNVARAGMLVATCRFRLTILRLKMALGLYGDLDQQAAQVPEAPDRQVAQAPEASWRGIRP